MHAPCSASAYIFPRAFRRFGFTSHFLLRFFIQFSRYVFQLLLQLLVGSNGLEPSTSRLSGVRSNHLSYEPIIGGQENKQREKSPTTIREFLTLDVLFITTTLHRKEVIQPHLPIRLPCYDFTPVANPTFGSVLTRLDY